MPVCPPSYRVKCARPEVRTVRSWRYVWKSHVLVWTHTNLSNSAIDKRYIIAPSFKTHATWNDIWVGWGSWIFSRHRLRGYHHDVAFDRSRIYAIAVSQWPDAWDEMAFTCRFAGDSWFAWCTFGTCAAFGQCTQVLAPPAICSLENHGNLVVRDDWFRLSYSEFRLIEFDKIDKIFDALWTNI